MLNIVDTERALRTLAYKGHHVITAEQVAYLSRNGRDEVFNYLISREPYVVNRVYESLCLVNKESLCKNLRPLHTGEIWCWICESKLEDENVEVKFKFTENYIKQVERDMKKKSLL